MIGKEIINYIEKNDIQNKYLFIVINEQVEEANYLQKLGNNLLISNKSVKIKDNILEQYFSKWFDIISICNAKRLWDNGYKNFYILLADGTDRLAENYDSWSNIQKDNMDALFGLEREDKKV